MIPSVIWPSELPQVQLDDKQGQAKDPQARTPLASGRTRTRLAFAAVPIDWMFSLVCTDAQALILDNFYTEVTKNGTVWFAMELDLPQGRGPWPFQFVGALPVPTRLGAPDQGLWRYSGIGMQQWLRPDTTLPGPDPDPTPEFLYTFTAQDVSDLTIQGFALRLNDALQVGEFGLRDGDILQIVCPDGNIWDGPSYFEHTDPLLGDMFLYLSYDEGSSISRAIMTGAGASGDQPWDSFVMGDYVEAVGPDPDPGPADCPEYPEWVGSTWSEYVTSSSITAPAFESGSIEEGDLLVMTLMARREPSSVPSGFTEVLRSPEVGNTSQFMVVYEKVATGSESNFPVSLSGTADRACVNVAAFRGSTTPVIASHDSELIGTSSQPNNQIDLEEVESPSLTSGGLLVLGITTSLTTNADDPTSQINIPFYGWAAIHNSYGTSTSHQNRMMISAAQAAPGESLPAKTPYVAMSNTNGLSTYKLLIATPG